MSFFHKLDNFYGNFIRLLSALLTLALLATAIMALVNWQRATASETAKAAETPPPKVASQDVIKRVIASQTGGSLDPISSTDPNHDAFERMSKAITAFEVKYGVPSDELDVTSTIAEIRAKVSYQHTAALKSAYASGLAETLEKTLSDARIADLLPKTDASRNAVAAQAIDIVSAAIDQYETDFSEQLDMAANFDDDHSQARKQRDAWTSLARVGGPLLLLILVLQLLTFGRIEQNTRSFGNTK